jgi:hypothetical protein
VERAAPGVLGVATGAEPPFALANASASFLFDAVRVVTEAVRARLADVSCWRTVVLLAAARARLSSAVPRRSIDATGAGIAALVPPNGSPPPEACSWRWRLRWARQKATFQALHMQLMAGRPSLSSTLHGKCWAARTAAKAIITSSTSAMGMPARFAFFLRIPHHDDELGDAIRLHIILHHISAEGDHVDGMQPPAVGIKGGHDVAGRDLRVEHHGILEIVIPDLIDDVMKEFCDASFGPLVTGVVIKAGFMGSLCLNVDDCYGIVGDVFVVEGEADGPDKLGVAMVGFVLGGIHEDGREGMGSFQLVIPDDHEQWEKGLPDCKQVVIGWLPFEGGEGAVCLFEEAGNCIGLHFC